MRHDPFEKTTRIPFKVVGGKLVHLYDGKPITELREGIIGDLVVQNYAVKDATRVQQYNVERKVDFLPKGTSLKAKISTQSVPEHLKKSVSTDEKFIGGAVEIILQEDSRLHLRGTKKAQLLPCTCLIPALAPILGDEIPKSVNQAYRMIALHFEPHRSSDAGNVFDLVFYRPEPLNVWQSLRHLRDQLQADHETLVAEKPISEQANELFLEGTEQAGLAEAIALAAAAHISQIDKAGAPYILHPLRVMQRLTGEDARIAAVLHDVIEDTDLTTDDLRRHGFAEQVVSAVEALTKHDGEPYEQFVERVRQHPVARQVKVADIEDNLDLLRLSEITDKDIERLRKYHQAWRRLLS